MACRNSSNPALEKTFVSFKLDGALFNNQEFENTDFHLLVLNRLTHRFQDYRSFGDISVVGNADQAATYLNELQPETIIVVGVAAVANWFPKLEYALQRCGAKLLQQTQSGPYGMVGVCRTEDAEDSRAAVTELWDSTFVELTGIIPFLYTAAPIAEFPAVFVQTVEKQDPFPSERPLKPELEIFKPENLQYDEFCDLETRKSMTTIDCEADKSKCPPAAHPCAHTYQNQMDEPKFWTITQRDINREYVEGVAEASQLEFDYKIAEFERIMDFVEFGVTIVAGAFAAFGPGSWATPGEEGAQAATQGSEVAQKGAKAAATKVPKNLPKSSATGLRRPSVKLPPPPPRKRPNSIKGPPPNLPESPARKKKLKPGAFERYADVADAIEDASDGTRIITRAGIDGQAKAATPNGDVNKEPQKTLDIPGGGKIAAIPAPKKPDDIGKATYENERDYNLAGWIDDNPIQQGLSRIMCDLYCTEDAVKAGNNAINTNVVRSNTALQTNLERLIDFQSKLIFFGLGQSPSSNE